MRQPKRKPLRRGRKKGPLTPRVRAFIEEYPAAGCNGAEAARRVGVPERSATVRAAEWLANPEIRAEIDKRLKAMADKAGITAERVVSMLVESLNKAHMAVMNCDRQDTLARLIAAEEKLLKLAGRHVDVKGFWDRMEVTGAGGGPVETVGRIEIAIVDGANAEG